MTRTAVANEPFTAVDGTAVESLTDSTARWTGVDFTTAFVTVTSNKANLAFGTGGAVMVFQETGTYTNDQYALATIGGSFDTNPGKFGMVVRCSGSGATSTYYEVEADTSSGTPYTTTIRKVVSQTPTTLGSTFTVAWVAGDTMVLEVVGTTLTVYQNTTALTTRSDASIANGKPGYSIRGINSHSQTLDDWEGGNATAGGGFVYSQIERNVGRGSFRGQL